MKARLVNLALSVAVSLLTLGSLEGVCRLWELRHPPPTVADYLWNWQQKWDGEFYVMESDAVGWPPWEEFNADGVRDRSHAVEKPEGVRRIAFLGDSVTFGDHVKRDEALPQQLEARLRADGRPVEVFNVAMMGWSTRQERIAYEKIARRYRPDDVVLSVCLNDIAELENNLAKPSPWLAALHRRSALVRVAVHAQWREITSVEELFTRRDSKKVREGMGRFFDEVRKLRDEVRADGGRLVVIVFPFRFQMKAGAPPPTVQEDIRSFADAEKIPFRDLLPALRRLGEAAFIDYDHLSPAGARRSAEDIAAAGVLEVPDPDADRGRLAAGGTAVLVDALARSASERERADAASVLGERRETAAVPALFAALRDPRAAVRRAAAYALYEIQPPPEIAVPRLTEAVANPDPYVRGFATWTLGNIGPAAAAAVPALMRALETSGPDAFALGGAAQALGKIGASARVAVPALVAALRSNDNVRRRTAARALGRIGPDAVEAVPPLLQAASDDGDDYLRGMAVRALGRIAPTRPEVITALNRALSDRIPEVRRQADIALRHR